MTYPDDFIRALHLIIEASAEFACRRNDATRANLKLAEDLMKEILCTAQPAQPAPKLIDTFFGPLVDEHITSMRAALGLPPQAPVPNSREAQLRMLVDRTQRFVAVVEAVKRL